MVFLFLSSLAVNSSLFNKTTVPSANELFSSSSDMVSALSKGRDDTAFEASMDLFM